MMSEHLHCCNEGERQVSLDLGKGAPVKVHEESPPANFYASESGFI